ncbi:hypothetical protein F5X99DRAFT_432562 [Biscogniauxia marginata]|nr:hypothetical protein F5X99DRAFT_432562 [Biscogniauxia marginata]
MPFDFKKYDEKCNGLTPEQLQREWDHYTRLIASASTSTAISGAAIPATTLGVSAVGIAVAAPAIHNARKKRAIIERHLRAHDTTHVTRGRDVLRSVAVSGAVGLATLDTGYAGVEGVAMAVEHRRLGRRKAKAAAASATTITAQPAEKARAVETVGSYHPVRAMMASSSDMCGLAIRDSPVPHAAYDYPQQEALPGQPGYQMAPNLCRFLRADTPAWHVGGSDIARQQQQHASVLVMQETGRELWFGLAYMMSPPPPYQKSAYLL